MVSHEDICNICIKIGMYPKGTSHKLLYHMNPCFGIALPGTV